MANPVVKTIDTDWEWYKIATAITMASIHLVNRIPRYYRTYRLTGESAPTNPTEETINKILNYLASKPYVEVAGMIHDLQTATPIEETEKKMNQDGEEKQ